MIRICVAFIFVLAAAPTGFADQSLADLGLAGQQPAPMNPPPPGVPGQPTPVNPTPPAQPKVATPAPGQRPATPPVDVPQRRMGLRGKDANLQIELTITDQTGSAAPEKKVVSMLIADQSMGRIRAAADAAAGPMMPGPGFVSSELNVDARPVILEGSSDRVLLEMTIEYTPHRTAEGEKAQRRPTQLNESLNVILTNGKSQIISQAADPATDRRMTVEVKATIVK